MNWIKEILNPFIAQNSANKKAIQATTPPNTNGRSASIKDAHKVVFPGY